MSVSGGLKLLQYLDTNLPPTELFAFKTIYMWISSQFQLQIKLKHIHFHSLQVGSTPIKFKHLTGKLNNGDLFAILDSSSQEISTSSFKLPQKSAICSKRSRSSLRGSDTKETVRGSNIILESSFVPTAAQTR